MGELTVKERDEYDESDRVKILQKVVGSAVQCHFTGLGDKVIPDLDPTHEVEREEEKDLDRKVGIQCNLQVDCYIPCSSSRLFEHPRRMHQCILTDAKIYICQLCRFQ